MNQTKRKPVIKPQTNIRVVREGNPRISDRRPPPAQWLTEEQPEPKKIHPSAFVQNSINGNPNKMAPSIHHSFHSANEADRLLDLSSSSSSVMSVKSCFGSFGTLKVKVPACSLREVQNLPDNMEIPSNSTSTPISLSPELGPKTKPVFAPKCSPGKKTFPSSSPSLINADVKNENPNGLANKTKGKNFDMFSASTKNKPSEIIVSDPTSHNSSKSDVLLSDCIGGGSEASAKTVSDQKARPIRVHQGSVSAGKILMQKKIPNNNNVQITNFSATDSLAARKALLTKKNQNAPLPVRRAVPAKAIISSSELGTKSEERKDGCHSCQEKSLIPDAVSAVAAATAAALSTQPLLSSQNKLESQLSMLLEKINTLERETKLKQKELESEGKNQKIDKLETQLNQVTDERMKYMEQLQKQLFGMQTKFLNVARSFEKMSGTGMVKHLQPETQKPTQTQNEKESRLNSSSNSRVDQELKDIPSMSSGYQSFSASLARQNSIPEDRASLNSSGCKDIDPKSVDSEKICATKNFNINNSGKSNTNGVGHHHAPKTIYAPFLEKKLKGQDQKVSFSGKPKAQDHKVPPSRQTRPSSATSKSIGNAQQKPVKEAWKNVPQKKTTSLKSKVGTQSQRLNKDVGSKPSKEKQVRGDAKNSAETKPQSSVTINSRYSVLKDLVSGGYSQQPYAIRKTDNIPKSTTERVLNSSYTIENPIVEKGDASKELHQLETNMSESKKEAPLEKYLLQSPVKSLLFTQDEIYSGQPPSFPSAEVLAGQEILRKAQTSRMVLEANLQKVERDQEKDSLYGLVDNLYEGSPARDRLQLRRKVDQCIAKVQKDIRNELSQAESIHSPPSKMKSKKSTGPVNDRKAPADNPASKKVSVVKDKNQDSDYLSKVFGKAPYDNKRTTVKYPYPRFQNQPKAKTTRPKETVPVKGVQMKSHKTQTPEEKEEISKPKGFDQLLGSMYIDNKKYYFATAGTDHPSSANLQHGHLGYMAVALREPRMDSGLKVPVTIRAGDSLTMAPEAQPKIVPASNVTVCNIPMSDDEQVIKKRPALVKQTLPCVVIEAQPETSQPYQKIITSHSKPPIEETEKKTQYVLISDEESDDEVDARLVMSESVAASEEDEKEESLIVLSSSGMPKLTGGKLSKPVAELIEKGSEEDILDSLHDHNFIPLVPFVPEADISRELPERNSPPDEALQWVEQEILSQMLSNHSHPPPLPSRTFQPQLRSSDFVFEVDDVPQNNVENSDPDVPVPRGLQTPFVPSPSIDKALISQLVEELLVDKVTDMIKDALAENSYSPITSVPTSPENESEKSESEKGVPSQPDPPPETPELTPIESEESLVSTAHDMPLPHTPSASPLSVSEDNSPVAEVSLSNDSPKTKLERSLFHEALLQDLDKLREEESFKVTHTQDTAAIDDNLETVVTPQRTPSSTPVVNSLPVTPIGSPSLQPEVLYKNREDAQIRTPSPSVYSPDSVEEAADIRPSKLPLTNTQDHIPPIKDDTSLKGFAMATAETNQSTKFLRSTSPEESVSVSSTASESETIFESLSVGQWLLSKSEGQAADFGIGEKAYQRILNDASTASTLRDTEDLFHDETTEMTYSEGEVVFKSRVPPERDPILELVSQMQNQNPLTLPTSILLQSNDENPAFQRSLGEFPLLRSELNLDVDFRKSPTDQSLEPNEKLLMLQPSGLAQAVSPHSDLEEDHLSEKEICPPQKGARIIEVGKRRPESSIMEPTSSVAEPIKWKGFPSRIEVGSISDSDQTNFMQKSVRFSEDGPISSVDYAAYLDSSSDLVASDMEKFSVRSSRESVPSHGDFFLEAPEQRRRMSVTIPQPDIFEEEDIEEISLGEEKWKKVF